ncbi:MAG TPA: lipid II flippase MurJ [Oscillospiraceae bacterium]|nr:lipid II flippase MurJ [Oscillospiraceae bacterium]
MFNSAALLTLATLAGLILGFAREWLLIDAWGAGKQSDAFLIALFLPEALRMTLAAGILSAAALPLYQQRTAGEQPQWLNSFAACLLLAGVILTGMLSVLAPGWINLIGPGLEPSAKLAAVADFKLLIWCVPLFFLHAVFTVILQAQQRYILAGLGSFLFNLFPVGWLLIARSEVTTQGLSLAFILGSFAMLSVLIPSAITLGWRPWLMRGALRVGAELWGKLGPLLLSNAASQGLTLLERAVASTLGEGMVTWVNLARKLINLPLIALMALNQVLLSILSSRLLEQRLLILRQGLAVTSCIALAAAVGLVAISPSLSELLFRQLENISLLALLLAWFAVPLVFGAWNPLLARLAYADGNTQLPLRCELTGNAVNALMLLALPLFMGVIGIALAAVCGALITAFLLLKQQNLLHDVPWKLQLILSSMALSSAAYIIYPMPPGIVQITWSIVAGALALIIAAILYKPWKA